MFWYLACSGKKKESKDMIKILSAINTHEAADSFQTYLIRRRMVMSLVYSNQIIINKGKNNIHDIIENLSGMYIYTIIFYWSLFLFLPTV